MYRRHLIQNLQKIFEVKTIGLFENKKSLLIIILKLIKNSNFIISSNIKTNIFCLLLTGKKGVVILNGLGRFRWNRFFRFLIIQLLKHNKSKKIICQNYLDFRYFKYLGLKEIIWIPGSGGAKRRISKDKKIIIVSRGKKIKSIKKSIELFCRLTNCLKINFVGISKDTLVKYFPKYQGFSVSGIVNQKKIFLSGNTFFQPSGYGEGIPHSLVDALTSKMRIIMFKKDFIQFGFYKIGIYYKNIKNNLILINSQSASNQLQVSKINKQYFAVIKNHIYTTIQKEKNCSY